MRPLCALCVAFGPRAAQLFETPTERSCTCGGLLLGESVDGERSDPESGIDQGTLLG